MKKILFALAILPLLAFVGCSSDDDDNIPKVDFAHDIELLYGEWRATSVEIMEGVNVDLTTPDEDGNLPIEETYVTFEKNGTFSSKGVLGEGKGTYTTKEKKINASIGDAKLDFEMTSLKATEAKIVLDAKALGLPDVPPSIENVTVVLTKQVKE